MVGLGITRNENETWLECALRYASKYGLENEVKEHYETCIENGETETEAAFSACYEWDICDLKEDV